ncbi:MAG: hypothetical protein HUJ75_03285, partial [Parasporobacterium sp.]|nr:hypothetical protein [Parasporobacterium sp.]
MKKVLALVLSLGMIICLLAGCGGNSGSNEPAPAPAADATGGAAAPEGGYALDKSWPAEKVKIGVVTFDTSDENYLGVVDYYESLKDYFNIEFMYSESIADAAAEMAYIDSCAAAGCKGIIAYYNVAGAESMKAATSKGMYYWGVEQYYNDMKDDPFYAGCYTFQDPDDPTGMNGDFLGGYELGYALGKQGRKHVVF